MKDSKIFQGLRALVILDRPLILQYVISLLLFAAALGIT
jgi:hypothetical protein